MQDEAVRIGACKEIWKAEGEMKKYIVKNCPATQYYTCEKYGICQDCPDCIIK